MLLSGLNEKEPPNLTACYSDHSYSGVSSNIYDPTDSTTQTYSYPSQDESSQTDIDHSNSHMPFHEKQKLTRGLTLDNILENDRSVRKYTGFTSSKMLYGVYAIVQKKVDKINYWYGKSHFERQQAGDPSRAKLEPRTRKLSRFQEYLMTFVNLRVGSPHFVLADMFGVSEALVSRITITWINVLYSVFRKWLKWPDESVIKQHLPMDFPAKYDDTRTILDCTEFFVVRPKNTQAQISTYSSYKHHNTAKLLIGISPSGLITFVSYVYGGNTSDRQITEAEFINLVGEGQAVMTDKGFQIGDLLLNQGVKLHIPPLANRMRSDGLGKGLSQIEIVETKAIASLRIHVERAIERMKNFRILTTLMDLNLWHLLDQIMVIVAVMCNFEPPLA